MTTLYYSNFCEPSKKLIQTVSKSKLKNELQFVCIDKRSRNKSGQTIVHLERGQVVLPSSITKVPALMTPQQVLVGDDIYKYLFPKEAQINHQATQGLGEPECYSLGQMNSMSDTYSFWDQPVNELTTKGEGGMRQLHNYVTLEQSYAIPTPSDNYEPDKIGKNGSKTLEQLKAEREQDVAKPFPLT